MYLYALLIVCISLILGQLGRIELFSGLVAVYPHDLILGVSLLYALWMRARIHKLLLLWFAWAVSTSLVHFISDPVQLAVSLAYIARLAGIVSFVYLLRSRIDRRLLLAVPIGIAFFGLLQYFFLPDTRSLVYLGWDDHYYRLIGTLFDPAFTGILLVFGILTIRSFIKKVLWSSVLGSVLTVALLLTYSRASYLALAAGLCIHALSKKTLPPLLFLLIFSFSLFFLPRPGGEGVKLERMASVNARIENIQGTIAGQSAIDWIVGSGFYANKSKSAFTDRFSSPIPNHAVAPDNSFLFLISSLGIVGLGISLALCRALLVESRFNETVLICTAALCVHALFSNTLFHPFVLLYFCLLMVGIVQRARQESRLLQD